ncbi:MAG: glycoside hydrolase family 3 N-terminal domain-containing protein, partial [Anaerolineae bacterium]
MVRIRRSWIVFGLLVAFTALMSMHQTVLAQDEPYRNPDLPVEERVEDLLARMTLEEKIGQMTLIEKNSLTPADVTNLFIGGVLSGGGGYPNPNTPEAWADMVRSFQEGALASRLGIPIIYGVDAVHGHNNVYGAVIFPHNVGLGATRNLELVQQIAQITAQEMIATGIYWDYAPVLAVVQDIRWGRTYEAYGENTELVTELSTAFIHGLQGDGLGTPGSVLATPKHYLGDGGTEWNTSPFGENHNDRGVTIGDEAFVRNTFLPPYIAAVEAGAMSVMPSYSSWGGLHMHEQHYLISEVLEGELGF